MSKVNMSSKCENQDEKIGEIPKWIEKGIIYFPAVHLVLISFSFFFFIKIPSAASFFILILFIYLLPLFLYRLVKLIFKIKLGVSAIGIQEEKGNSWILIHRLQYIFITFQFLEKILILLPGVFSLWLRLWGSQVGKKVMWTPRVEVLDRTHLDIGDYCFFGDHCYLSSHFIVRRKGKLYLYFDKIKIGKKVLIGAYVHLGPGVNIKENTFIPSYSKGMKSRWSFIDNQSQMSQEVSSYDKNHT